MKERPTPSRSGVLHAVIDEILTRDDGQMPTDIEGITTYFSTIDDLANAGYFAGTPASSHPWNAASWMTPRTGRKR